VVASSQTCAHCVDAQFHSFAAFFWPRGHVDWVKLQAIYTKLTVSPVSWRLASFDVKYGADERLLQAYSDVANGSPAGTSSSAAATSSKKKKPAKPVLKAELSEDQGPALKKIKLIHHPYSAVAAAQPQVPSQYTAFATNLSPEVKKEEEPK
jgi:hypothetical protein